MKIIECVPNFSEGRDDRIINQITESINSINGVSILDIDKGFDTNRTVVTFVGTPENVINAAFSGIKKATELIDMRKHKGAHARMGATDVCPFIPISNVSMQECVEYSNILANIEQHKYYKKTVSKIAKPMDLPKYISSAGTRTNPNFIF